MQYEANTPEKYLGALTEDWRKETLLAVREMIRKNGLNLKEGIEYKMLSFGDGKRTVFHLNAQKQYVGLYVGDIRKIDTDGNLLQDFDLGKGCIRIKKSNDLTQSQLNTFIQKTIDLWRRGEDVDC